MRESAWEPRITMVEDDEPKSTGKIQTWTGKFVDPLHLRPEDVDLEDIAHHLSMVCRFGGAVRRHYSVAEHSLLVASLVPPEHRLRALLHDAAEAYLGDIVRPMKKQPEMDHYRGCEHRAQRVIFDVFGVDASMKESFVSHADRVALSTERSNLMRHVDHEAWRQQQLPPPLDHRIRFYHGWFVKWRFKRAVERELERRRDEEYPRWC